MKKAFKKALILLGVWCAICATTLTTYALPQQPLNGSIQIVISPKGNGETVVIDADVSLYKLADVDLENGKLKYKLLSHFLSCGIDLNDLDTTEKLQACIDKLQEHITANSVAQTAVLSAVSDRFNFTDVERGYYLVVATCRNNVTISSFLVSVPEMDIISGDLKHDVVAYPKTMSFLPPSSSSSTPPSSSSVPPGSSSTPPGSSSVPPAGSSTPELPPGPPTAPPPNTKLPQTGQLQWPVPVLSVVGVLLFSWGWADLYLRKKKSENDKST